VKESPLDLSNLSETVEKQETTNVIYVERRGNGLAVAALVLGIIGLVFGFIPLFFWIALPLGVVGLILGIPAILRANKGSGGKIMAVVGTVLSAGAIALGVWGAVIVGEAVDEINEVGRELDRDIQKASDDFDRSMQKSSDDFDREMQRFDEEMERIQRENP